MTAKEAQALLKALSEHLGENDVAIVSAIISRSELLRFIFNPFGVGASLCHKTTGFTKAIISRSELLRFIFNPFGVGTFHIPFHRFYLWLLSRSARYYVSYSTPLGLVQNLQNPQVSPVAIISLRSLLRFIFNPFGVGTFHIPFL
jgi:hypothetical protein